MTNLKTKKHIILSLLIVVGAILIGYYIIQNNKPRLREGEEAQEQTQGQERVISEKRITRQSDFGGRYEELWSADSKKMVFTRYLDENPQGPSIWTANADGTGLQRLTDSKEEAIGPLWSPDGSKILYISNKEGKKFLVKFYDMGQVRIKNEEHRKELKERDKGYGEEGTMREYNLWMMDSDGSSKKRLTPLEEGVTGFDWSPDGSKIAYLSGVNEGADVWIADETGGNPQRLTQDNIQRVNLAWSPDGSKLFFEIDRNRGGHFGRMGDLCVINIDDTDERCIVRDDRVKWNPAWSPDSKKIIFEALPFDVRSWTEDASFPPHTIPQDLWIVDVETGEQQALKKANPRESVAKSEWSPDGSQILFELAHIEGTSSVWVMSPDGTNQTKLTKEEVEKTKEFDPALSPDGSKIAFSLLAGRGGSDGRNLFGESDINSDIWIMDIDGDNRQQLTTSKMDDFSPLWSPDDKKIAFFRGGDLWVIELEEK